MEATGVYWKPIWHILEEDFELVLANASHIKNVPGRKTDVNDATWIADLLAHGLIRSSFVPPFMPLPRATVFRFKVSKKLSLEVLQGFEHMHQHEVQDVALAQFLSDALLSSAAPLEIKG